MNKYIIYLLVSIILVNIMLMFNRYSEYTSKIKAEKQTFVTNCTNKGGHIEISGTYIFCDLKEN